MLLNSKVHYLGHIDKSFTNQKTNQEVNMFVFEFKQGLDGETIKVNYFDDITTIPVLKLADLVDISIRVTSDGNRFKFRLMKIEKAK